jgi:predicted nucleic acid-binding protein
MADALDAIPNGSNVLIDTNIFLYGITDKSAQCKEFLRRCSSEELYGITLYEIVHEATHHFMVGEALAKGVAVAKVGAYLKKHPNAVKSLTDYWNNTETLLALNILFLPMERQIVQKAQTERVNAGLMTIDSVIVGAMREYGITRLATNDGDFDSVAGISTYSPNDLVP